MKDLMMSLGIIIVGISLGQLVKYMQKGRSEDKVAQTTARMNKIREFAFLILNPVVMVNAYWVINFSRISMLSLPIICLIVLGAGGGISLLASKALKHTKEQKASMFGCGTFSNLGTIGSLITLIFLGEEAFAIAALYLLFESFYNYLFAYPMIKGISEGGRKNNKKWWSVFSDVTIIVYVSSIFVGLALNLSGLSRPTIMGNYNTYMVPVISFLLTFAISYKMEFKKIQSNFMEGIICIGIKYCFSPILAVSLGMLLGLQHIQDGLIIKVLIIMSTVPCGFNSILVPTIYKSDADVANSVWIMSMIMLIVTIPLEYFLLMYL